jgi:type VI secretion system protein VasI
MILARSNCLRDVAMAKFKKMTSFGVLVTGLVLVANTVRASDGIEKSLAKCAVINGELDRLGCYDNLAKRFGLAGPQEQKPASTGLGKWRVSKKVNPIDDSVTVTAILDADSGLGRRGEEVFFVARCQSNETEAYIGWEDYVGDDSSSVYENWKYVTVRIGDGDAEVQKWGVSTSKDATFAPNWAGTLLKKMAKSNKFIVQTTPYGENPVTAIFDTTGMMDALEPLAETCGWSLR